MSALSEQLRMAASELRKQASEQKYGHAIKCAQVLAGAKGLNQLYWIMQKAAESATARTMPADPNAYDATAAAAKAKADAAAKAKADAAAKAKAAAPAATAPAPDPAAAAPAAADPAKPLPKFGVGADGRKFIIGGPDDPAVKAKNDPHAGMVQNALGMWVKAPAAAAPASGSAGSTVVEKAPGAVQPQPQPQQNQNTTVTSKVDAAKVQPAVTETATTTTENTKPKKVEPTNARMARQMRNYQVQFESDLTEAYPNWTAEQIQAEAAKRAQSAMADATAVAGTSNDSDALAAAKAQQEKDRLEMEAAIKRIQSGN